MHSLTRTICLLLAAFVLFGYAIFSPSKAAQPTSTPEAPFPVATPVVATPIVPTPAPTQPPAVPSLTQEMLANLTYSAPYTPDNRLPLQNGQFTLNQENPPVRVFTRLMASAFGDLNGDGVEDAVAVLGTNTGGTGTFFELYALLNQNGMPLQVAVTGFGDRQLVKALRIENGQIVLDYMTQGPNDGLCCPSQHNLRTYVLEGGLLSLTGEQVLESEAAQGAPLPNRIIIDRPVDGEQLYGKSFEVRGRVSQVPAGGTLAYHVTDSSGGLLQEGTLPVSGAPGQLGSFSFQITLDERAQYLAYVDIVDAQNGALLGRTVTMVVLPAQ